LASAVAGVLLPSIWNPSATEAVLFAALEDGDDSVREAAAANL